MSKRALGEQGDSQATAEQRRNGHNQQSWASAFASSAETNEERKNNESDCLPPDVAVADILVLVHSVLQHNTPSDPLLLPTKCNNIEAYSTRILLPRLKKLIKLPSDLKNPTLDALILFTAFTYESVLQDINRLTEMFLFYDLFRVYCEILGTTRGLDWNVLQTHFPLQFFDIYTGNDFGRVDRFLPKFAWMRRDEALTTWTDFPWYHAVEEDAKSDAKSDAESDVEEDDTAPDFFNTEWRFISNREDDEAWFQRVQKAHPGFYGRGFVRLVDCIQSPIVFHRLLERRFDDIRNKDIPRTLLSKYKTHEDVTCFDKRCRTASLFLALMKWYNCAFFEYGWREALDESDEEDEAESDEEDEAESDEEEAESDEEEAERDEEEAKSDEKETDSAEDDPFSNDDEAYRSDDEAGRLAWAYSDVRLALRRVGFKLNEKQTKRFKKASKFINGKIEKAVLGAIENAIKNKTRIELQPDKYNVLGRSPRTRMAMIYTWIYARSKLSGKNPFRTETFMIVASNPELSPPDQMMRIVLNDPTLCRYYAWWSHKRFTHVDRMLRTWRLPDELTELVGKFIIGDSYSNKDEQTKMVDGFGIGAHDSNVHELAEMTSKLSIENQFNLQRRVQELTKNMGRFSIMESP